MKYMYTALMMVLAGLSLELWLGAEAVSDQHIADTAMGYTGSTVWSYASNHRTGSNTNKCNIFVAEVLEGAGASVPHRWWFIWSPIGAGEWGDPNSSYLTSDNCWTHRASAATGYVIGDGVHVGIVTGNQQTTSAAHDAVVNNDWGFRAGQTVTFWDYTC